MLPIAGQTTGPNGLKFFVDTQGFQGVFRLKKIRFFFKFFFQNFFYTGNAGPFNQYYLDSIALIVISL